MAGFKDIFDKLNSKDYFDYSQGFNEMDYNRYFDQNQREEEIRKIHERMAREADERAQRAHEREREMERRRLQDMQRIIERQRIQQQRIFDFEGQINSFGAIKSKKEALIDRLAVKFCFFRNAILSIQTSIAMGNIGLAVGNYNAKSLVKRPHLTSIPDAVSLLKRVFDSVVNEAEQNGITRIEISDAVNKFISKGAELNMNEMLIKNFLGAVAIRMFKKNPNIIKDTGKKKDIDSTNRKGVPNPRPYEDNDAYSFERIRQMIEEMTREEERRRREGVINPVWIVDYPNYFQHKKSTSVRPTFEKAWLDKLKSEIDDDDL